MIRTYYYYEGDKFLKCTQIWDEVDGEDTAEKELVGIDNVVFYLSFWFSDLTAIHESNWCTDKERSV